ncbi:CaiB/BaiF CoA transferase family protein [Streptosporangium sp. NPDC002607]
MKVLDGIRILDLTTWAFCPAAGTILASWGADVIHIENPSAPDPMRVFDGGGIEPGQANWMFRHYNRGKRAIALNLADDEGREIIHRLAETADVFLTSYLPATRRKLGVDIDDIRARNPRIVYAKGTGAGPRGPEAERGGYDSASWWARGSLAGTAMAVTGIDRPSGMVGHGDGMSGLVFAGGICAALLQRERTGVAPVVDASLLGSAMWFNAPAIISSTFPPGRQAFNSRPAREQIHWTGNTYRTADGRFLSLTLLGDHERDWRDLCLHLDRLDLLDDSRFAGAANRARHSAELVRVLDETFATRSLSEWRTILVTMSGVWAPVQTPRETHDDPQVIANGFIQEVEYPDGPLPLVVPPILFDQDPGRPKRAPEFAEHTAAVLEEAGYSPEAIARHRERGVIA